MGPKNFSLVDEFFSHSNSVFFWGFFHTVENFFFFDVRNFCTVEIFCGRVLFYGRELFYWLIIFPTENLFQAEKFLPVGIFLRSRIFLVWRIYLKVEIVTQNGLASSWYFPLKIWKISCRESEGQSTPKHSKVIGLLYCFVHFQRF